MSGGNYLYITSDNTTASTTYCQIGMGGTPGTGTGRIAWRTLALAAVTWNAR